MVTIKRARIATAVLLLLGAGACTTDGGQSNSTEYQEVEIEYDHTPYHTRPHDYAFVGLELLEGVFQVSEEPIADEPAACTGQFFAYDHIQYIANEVHTAWHIYEEDSPRTFDAVLIEVTEYTVSLQCEPSDTGPLFCFTDVAFGLKMTTSGGGGPTLVDTGWSGYTHASHPTDCTQANHRVDMAASTAVEQTLAELYKRVETTDQ